MGHEVLGNQASHVPNEEHTRTELDIQSARDEIPSALDESPGAVVQRLLTVSLGFALFLVGLDSTITSTAVPTITDHFHFAGDIGWFTSAYLLATSASQLYYGKLYSLFSSKVILLSSLFIFEVGAIVAGSAPTAVAFIVGRSISGLGRAGIFSGAMIVMKEMLPLEKRPIGGSIMGAIETIAVVSAPVLGGVLTSKASWRWCFLINPPLGAVVFAILFWLLPNLRKSASPGRPAGLRVIWTDFDHVGALLIAGSAICMLLALQWGGFTYPWSDSRVITLFILSGVFLLAFVILEYFQKEKAILPLHYCCSRTISMGSIFSFMVNGTLILVDNYLPIWFQVAKRASAISSGLMLLPTIISMLFGVAFSGFGTSYLGYYVPFMILSSICLSIATGLFTTLQVTTSKSLWIVYQIIFGFGIGSGLQQPFVAAQTLENKKGRSGVESATAIILFTQTLGGALTASIAQNIMLGQLIHKIPALIPRINSEMVKNTGLTELVQQLTTTEAQILIPIINNAITSSFKLALVCSCLSLPAALYMKWKFIKAEKSSVDTTSNESSSCQEEISNGDPKSQSKGGGL